MNILQLAQIVIGSIIALGILVAGAGYLWGQVFVGRNKATKEDFDLFNSQIDALKKIIEEQKDQALESARKRDEQIAILQADIKVHTAEIGRLTGIIEEKDKKIVELTELVKNRDPALSEYIKFARDAIIEFKDAVKRIHVRVDNSDAKSDKILELLANK